MAVTIEKPRHKERSTIVSVKPYQPKAKHRKHKKVNATKAFTSSAANPPGCKEKTVLITRRHLRKAATLKKSLAKMPITGPNRPLSRLDEQAKGLGIYNETFHLLNRKGRKSLVSTALSAAVAA